MKTTLRVLIWFVIAAAVMLGAVWLAERPGIVTAEFRGWRLDTSVGVLMISVVVLILVSVGGWLLYRWIVGVFDASLSVFAMTFLSPDGTMSKFGLVLKDGKLYSAKDVDIVTYIEADGFTHRGGRVRVTLANGEVMDMECEILQKGTVNSHHGNTWLDTFCKMTWGDKVGVCDFEIANRPFQGTTAPVLLEKAITENGLFAASV